MLFGGVEAGGTKFVCATGDETGKIQERVELPTRDPEETVKDVIGFFSKFETKAIGIASFGRLTSIRKAIHMDTLQQHRKRPGKIIPLNKR